jgi:hypothetical protein
MDINGIGIKDNMTIVFGRNATLDDVLALIVINEMEENRQSQSQINKFVDQYRSKNPMSVIVAKQTSGYYKKFRNITNDLIATMIRSQYVYATINSGNQFIEFSEIPFYWATQLSKFRSLVGNKGPLDLKQQSQWQDSSLYYFNGVLVDSDAPGNILYGYIGKAFGFPDVVLYGSAGLAQIAAGTSEDVWFFTSFGDDPIDQANIRRGIAFYKKYNGK